MKALILKDKVVDISENDFPVAAPLMWVDCDDSTAIEDIFDGENFIKPAPIPPAPYTPSDLEIRIAALEDKTGVTETDREAARHKLIERNTR